MDEGARFFCAFMDLIVLHVLASYCFLAVGRAFPVWPGSLSLFLALAVSRAGRESGMRVATYALLNVGGLFLSLGAAYLVFCGPLSSPEALVPQGGRAILEGLLVLAWSATFWLRGERLGRKKADHAFCVSSLDKGLALILAVLSVAALLRVSNPFAEKLSPPYLFFAVLALSSSKREGSSPGNLVHGSGNGGMVRLAFSFALASAGVLLLVPALMEPARRTALAMRRAWRAAEPWLLEFLRWLFSSGRKSSAAADAASAVRDAGVPSVSEASELGHTLGRIAVYVLCAAASLAMLVFLAYGLAALIRALSGRMKKDGDGPGLSSFPAWLKDALRRLAGLFSWLGSLLSRRRHRSAAVAAYARYLACGKGAGLRRGNGETPREYAVRLRQAFPRSAGKADYVVEALQREVYGGQTLDPSTERRLIRIRGTLSPISFQAERLKRLSGKRRQIP